MAVSDTSPLRRANVSATLSALRSGAIRTVAELAAVTGLSRPTVEDAVVRLTELGMVEELAPAAGGGAVGRPARRYRFRPDAGVVLGLEIGEHQTIALVADLTGEILDTLTRLVAPTAGREARLSTTRAAIRAVLARSGYPRSRVWAAAAGTAGLVDTSGRVVVSHVLPGWNGLNLAATLRRSLACPVDVDNDANLAALAEHWRGAATGVDDVIYVRADQGLGAGILIGGRVRRGVGGAAGEIGALPMLRSLPRHLTAFAAARPGSAAARTAITQFAHDLAPGIAAMASTIDPELVVIAGPAARAGDLLTEPLLDRLRDLCVRPPRVAVSTLDERSAALGAVRAALDHVDREVFGVDTSR